MGKSPKPHEKCSSYAPKASRSAELTKKQGSEKNPRALFW